MLDHIFLLLRILLLFHIALNRVRMIFARLSILCNSLALSADRCALRLEKMHFVSLEPLNPWPLESYGITPA